MLIRLVAAAKIAMDGATLPGCAHRLPHSEEVFENNSEDVRPRALRQAHFARVRRQHLHACDLDPTEASSSGAQESSKDETSSRRAVALWPVMRPAAVPGLISGSYFLDFESPAGFGATCTL